MTLHPPNAQGSRTQSSNELQREVAERVTKRWEDRHRKEKRAARIASIKNYCVICILCGILGGGYYVWTNGLLEKWLTKSDSIIPSVESRLVSHQNAPKKNEQQVTKVEVPSASTINVADKEQILDRYSTIVKTLNSITIDYWKNAPTSDNPSKAGVPLTFLCLLPDDNGSPLILELQTAPGSKMKVKQVSASLGTIEFSMEDFNRLIKKSPYLIVREGRGYLADSHRNQLNEKLQFPTNGEVNPSKLVFGLLYGVMMEMKVPKPNFKYCVKFFTAGDNKPIVVATVGFGDIVNRISFEKKIAERYGLDVSSDSMAIDAVIRMGKFAIETL